MKQRSSDAGELKKYFAAIPNIVLTLGLKPHELALYVHLKKAAGDDGECFKSRPTIAKEAGMSPSMVTKARKVLEAPRSELHGQSLIHVREEANKQGGKPRCVVTITDIWPINMAFSATAPYAVQQTATSYTVSTTAYGSPQGHMDAPKKNQEEEPKKNTDVRTVFLFWQDHLDHPKSQIDARREKAIRARLRTHSVEDVLTAIRGCKMSAYHMGQNDRHVKFDDIELICRDNAHLERFMALAGNGNGRTYVDDEWDKAKTIDEIKAMVEA